MSKCLECQKKISENEGLFCSDNDCGQKYVDQHFRWSKTVSNVTNLNQQGYQVQCKACLQTLKNVSRTELDDKMIEELNNHLPNCSKQKPHSHFGSRCCTCSKPDSDLVYQQWLKKGGIFWIL